MKTECKKGRIIPKNIHEGPLKLMGRYRLLNEEDSANMGELPNTGILLVHAYFQLNSFFSYADDVLWCVCARMVPTSTPVTSDCSSRKLPKWAPKYTILGD